MFAWIAVLVFVLVTSLAAGRLFLLWRETRCLPELLIAILIFGVGTIAVGSSFLINQLMDPGPVRTVVDFIPQLGAAVGMTALSIFTWRVYRPASAMARNVAVFFAVGGFGLIALAVASGSVAILATHPYIELSSFIQVAVMLWSAGEAFSYLGPMRRRLALDLADPMVVNRFLLWGIATGTAGLGIAIGGVGRILTENPAMPPAWISLNYALHGMASAFAFWFAFKPPRAYAQWVRNAAARNSEA